MSNKELYNIQKTYFSELQSNSDKLLNSLKSSKFNLNEDNLNSILLINKLIEELNYNISDLDNQIINKIPINRRSDSIKERLDEYNNHNKIIKKYLPFMIAENLMS